MVKQADRWSNRQTDGQTGRPTVMADTSLKLSGHVFLGLKNMTLYGAFVSCGLSKLRVIKSACIIRPEAGLRLLPTALDGS